MGSIWPDAIAPMTSRSGPGAGGMPRLYYTRRPMDDRLKATLLLLASNTFMTIAWYGHLKFKEHAPRLPVIIAISWGIALFEYMLQVPANRIGYRVLSAY